MKRIALLLACALMSLTLCSCAIEPIYGAAPYQNEPTQSAQSDQHEDADYSDAMTADGRHILCNSEDLLITVDSVEFTAEESCVINVTLENRSDTVLSFYCDTFSVNGWQVDTFYYITVESGKTLRDTIEYYQTDFSDMLPDSVDEISIAWEVGDAVDMTTDLLINDTFTFSVSEPAPDGIKIKQRRTTDSETVILDDERFTFVVMEIDDKGLYGPEAFCYLENKTDKTVSFNWDNVSVNGWEISYYFGKRMLPGCRTYFRATFSESDYALCGIDQILELGFELSVQDRDYEVITSCSAYLYPTGLTSADIPTPERTPKDGEIVLVDDERCTAILEPAAYDSGTYTYGLYLHNKTEDLMEIYIHDIVANGDSDVSFFKYRSLPAYGFTYMSIDIYDFELMNSTSVKLESIEFHTELSCSDDSSMEIIFDETVTMKN